MVQVANTPPLALSFLLHRLKWPVPMVRWRTAKEIRNLLHDSGTRSSTTEALLGCLAKCRTESEVCEVLTIVFLTSPDARPMRSALTSRVHCPSILADIILERTYGHGQGMGAWRQAHSGPAPSDFKVASYFEEHKSAHVAPILESNLRELEHATGYPFLQQWAHEWETLRGESGQDNRWWPD